MNAKERAEKIIKGQPLGTTLDEAVKFCAAQIEEAEREQAESDSMKHAEVLMGTYSKACAEGFRAAREKAKGIAEEYLDEGRIGEVIAQRIGEMEPDK